MIQTQFIMKVLIVYGTSENHTKKVALFVEKILIKGRHDVVTSNSAIKPIAPDNFDFIIIACSVHFGKYKPAIQNYISQHVTVLNNKPSAFYSVSLAAIASSNADQREAEMYMADVLNKTKWKPMFSIHIEGALKYSSYHFFKRILMKSIAKKKGLPTNIKVDHEFTNWEKIDQFTLNIIQKTEQMI